MILFLIVPINLAIDDAPNRLLNINQTILVFTTLAITYKVRAAAQSSTTSKSQYEKTEADSTTAYSTYRPGRCNYGHSTYRPGRCNYGHSTYWPGRCNYRHSTYRPGRCNYGR